MKKEIIIKTQTNEERYEIGTKIHNQLVGNQDYIENRIILNIDEDCTVHYWVFEDSITDPEITI